LTEARAPEPNPDDPSGSAEAEGEQAPFTAPPDPEGEPPLFPVPLEVADYEPAELAPPLAAICFALNRPVTISEAAAILGRSRDDVARAADHLAGTLRGGGLMLQRHQNEIQVVTRPEVAWAVQRALNPEKPGRLSRAALETLAIVAYRQPLTRAAIEAIRGVNCEAVLDSLEGRGLVIEIARQDTPGHPRLFGTTLRFLQVVGLERIEDLPPLPEGLQVPELPAADWEATPPEPARTEAAARGPAPDEPDEPTMEVRGSAVDPEPHSEDEGHGADGHGNQLQAEPGEEWPRPEPGDEGPAGPPQP
jgi:segregation and condensation protein B